MENDALWSTDKKDGIEKSFCCINATARDYAKLGYFMLNKGKNVEADCYRLCDTSTSLSTSTSTLLSTSAKNWAKKNPHITVRIFLKLASTYSPRL